MFSPSIRRYACLLRNLVKINKSYPLYPKVTSNKSHIRFRGIQTALTSNSNYASNELQTSELNRIEIDKESTIYPTVNNNLEHMLRDISIQFENKDEVSKEQIEEILKSVKEKGAMEKKTGIILLRCCSNLLLSETAQTRLDTLWDIWKVIITSVHNIDVDFYREFCNAHIEIGVEDNGMFNDYNFSTFYNSIINENNDDRIIKKEIYPLLLKYYCQFANSHVSTIWYQRMIKENIFADKDFFPILRVSAMTGSTDGWKDGTNLLNKNKDNPAAYVYVLRGAAEIGDEKHFNYIYEMADKEGIQFDAEEKLSIIKSLALGKMDSYIPKVNYNTQDKLEIRNMINLCTKLICNGDYDIAFKIMKNLSSYMSEIYSNTLTNAEYLVDKMIYADTPYEDILNICNELISKNKFLLKRVTFTSLKAKKHELSLKLLKNFQNFILPVRNHYFWPIFISRFEETGEQGMLDTIRDMLKLDVIPNYETMKLYILPSMDTTDIALTIRKLQDYGLRVTGMMTPILAYLIERNRLKDTKSLWKFFNSKVDFTFLEKKLAKAYMKTGDVNSVIFLIKRLGAENSANNFMSHLLLMNVDDERGGVNITDLKRIMKGFANENLRIGVEVLKDLRKYIGENVKDDPDKEWFENLIQNSVAVQWKFPHLKCSNIDELEAHLTYLIKNDLIAKGVIRRLIILYCADSGHNIHRVKQLLQLSKERGYEETFGVKSAVMELLIKCGELKEAMKLFEEIESNKSFYLDRYKIMQLAIALANDEQYEKAVELIKKYRMENFDERMWQNCYHFLKAFYKLGDPYKLIELLDLLVSQGYYKYYTKLCTVVIQCFLHNDDLDGAFNEYKRCIRTHRLTPGTFYLLRKIEEYFKNDEEKVVSDLTKEKCTNYVNEIMNENYNIHGITSASHIYVMAMADVGNFERLKKFIMEKSTVLDQQVLDKEILRFSEMKRLNTLNNLRKGLCENSEINLDVLHASILNIHCRDNNYKDALKLLEDIKESGRTPTRKFLRVLSTLLIKNKQPVPFFLDNNNI